MAGLQIDGCNLCPYIGVYCDLASNAGNDRHLRVTSVTGLRRVRDRRHTGPPEGCAAPVPGARPTACASLVPAPARGPGAAASRPLYLAAGASAVGVSAAGASSVPASLPARTSERQSRVRNTTVSARKPTATLKAAIESC